MQSGNKAIAFSNLKLSYFSVTHSLVSAPWMLSKLIARVTGAPKYYVSTILIKNLHISLCRKSIKPLIKQVKQFTTGTVKFVRITVKPVQQPMKKLQIYTIQSRMAKSVQPCN